MPGHFLVHQSVRKQKLMILFLNLWRRNCYDQLRTVNHHHHSCQDTDTGVDKISFIKKQYAHHVRMCGA